MSLLDELLKNPETLQQFINKAVPKDKKSTAAGLFEFLRYSDSPLLRKYMNHAVINPAVARLQLAAENPFCELPESYLEGDFAVGFWAMDPSAIVKIDLTNISGSIVIAGATGSGKTNTLLWILDQIQKQYND